MGLLFDILAFPLMGPIKGVTWIAEKLVEQADKELYSEDAIRGKLLELELRFDMGEIAEKDYNEQEETLLGMLRIARERQAPESD
ncbi:MAG: gas vesicle protein GvpG [Anaerolineales bacterium]|nr:gas vesicle protein GvpG [Anaerolineales bacterium]